MQDWRGEIRERAELFAAENGRTLIGQLGYGYDGNVFATERQSAIMVLLLQRLYQRDVYLRRRLRSIVDVARFAVPQLIHHDDRLWGVEMGIVSPPFRLDGYCACWYCFESSRLVRLTHARRCGKIRVWPSRRGA